MKITPGMILQHIDTKAVGSAVREPYVAARNWGAQRIEYIEVAVKTEKGVFHRTWRTENVRMAAAEGIGR
jgi:hypothetical protein